VSDLVKTLRTAPFALLALVLALAVVGSSCSAADPVALQVGEWQLSTKTFQEQLNTFYDAYSKATSQTEADTALKATVSSEPGAEKVKWSTQFTAQFLNDQLNLQLAKLAVAKRGLEVTQTDLDDAKATLEKNYADKSGQSVFGALTEGYQQSLIEGVAAQTVLQADLIKDKTTDEALRKIYDNDPSLYAQACVSHILVVAGQPDGKTTPSDAAYADALAKIQQVQSQLKGTSNFADLATANSADTGSAAKGGDLGCAPKGTYVTEFDDAVWSQPIGVVSAPVKSIFGYHLILVTSRTTPSFEDVKAQILKSVQSAASGLMSDELASIAKTTTITVDGRYGQFDATTGQITEPAGAEQPSTSSTVDPLLGAGAQ
jgi:parvulin-like peptidyl-prolyl isomerase